MNIYFINLFETIKSGQFCDDSFVPDEHMWKLSKSWYQQYSDAETISDKELLDLLYFFYVHENMDFYDKAHFDRVGELLYEKYKIRKSDLLKMFISYRELIYG